MLPGRIVLTLRTLTLLALAALAVHMFAPLPSFAHAFLGGLALGILIALHAVLWTAPFRPAPNS